MKQSRKRALDFVNSHPQAKIELGSGQRSGKVRGDDWLTIDINDECDIYWDLTKGIPLPSSSVVYVYSSHFFEHLNFPTINMLIGECQRVLRPGGVFDICVPNARLFVEAYLNEESFEDSYYFDGGRAQTGSPIDDLNYTAYMGGGPGGHKYMFDEKNIVAILKSAGLVDVRLREFNPILDLESRKWESVFALGQKK